MKRWAMTFLLAICGVAQADALTDALLRSVAIDAVDKYPSQLSAQYQGAMPLRIVYVAQLRELFSGVHFDDAAQTLELRRDTGGIRLGTRRLPCEDLGSMTYRPPKGKPVKVAVKRCDDVKLEHVGKLVLDMPWMIEVPMTAAAYQEAMQRGVFVEVLFTPGAGVNSPVGSMLQPEDSWTLGSPVYVTRRHFTIKGRAASAHIWTWGLKTIGEFAAVPFNDAER